MVSGSMNNDKNDCAVYAVAFTCHCDPDVARFQLWRAGRDHADGATDAQIARAVRKLGRTMRRVSTACPTVRTFSRIHTAGTFLVTTTDHVVAVVDGRVCDKNTESDLLRIEKVHRIQLTPV